MPPDRKSRILRPRTLLVLGAALIIVGVALTACLPYYWERQTLARIEQLNGTAKTELIRPIWIPRSLDESYLKFFTRIYVVDLSDSEVTGADLVKFQSLTNLRGLVFERTKISDAGLANLAILPPLEYLYLDETDIGDAGAVHLGRLTTLRTLSLASTEVSDDGVRQLRNLSDLESLDLSHTNITDAALADLRELKKLKFIWLLGTQTTDAAVELLRSDLPNCRIVAKPADLVDSWTF